MEKKIKILLFNFDKAGVNYFRTETPAIAPHTYHSDKFEVSLNPNINFEDKN